MGTEIVAKQDDEDQRIELLEHDQHEAVLGEPE